MMPPNGGVFNNFNTPPPSFGAPPPIIGGGNNQASGDSFNSPWNYGGGFEQAGNLTMRQQMLKEANSMSNVSFIAIFFFYFQIRYETRIHCFLVL